jgi:hypothetical protein
VCAIDDGGCRHLKLKSATAPDPERGENDTYTQACSLNIVCFTQYSLYRSGRLHHLSSATPVLSQGV